MGVQATLVYSVEALGISSVRIQPFVASAPIPPDILQALGLRVLSDGTTIPAVNPVVRTIVLGFQPSVAALLLPPTISNTNRIERVLVDPVTSGLDYILAPIIRANNNAREPLFDIVHGNVVNKRPRQRDALFKAFMACYQAAVVTPGSGYTAATTTVTFLGGLPPANAVFDSRRGGRDGAVRYVNIANPGRGYDPLTAQLSIQGGGPNGNTPAIPARGVLTINPRNGSIQSIQIVDMGQGYVTPPQVVVTSPTGAQPTEVAKLFAVMAEGRPARGTLTIGAGPGFPVTAITVTDAGDNYVTVPEVLIRDTGAIPGTGATGRARMGLGRVDTINEGVGYFQGTTFSITSAFEDFFPTIAGDPQAQAVAFFQFLQGTISQLAITPVTSVDPLVA